MQNVFRFRQDLIDEYQSFSRSFTRISAKDIKSHVESEYNKGRYWPEPLVQINPNYQRGSSVRELVQEGSLHPGCDTIFQVGRDPGSLQSIRLFTHQVQAVSKALQGRSFVVTTGTGSGKSLAFFLPIIDRVLKSKRADPAPRTRAIIIYPMNALANSQVEEIGKFMENPGAADLGVRIARYTGQESKAERDALAANPPDILLTNFMMLELILTRFEEVDRQVVDHCQGLEFLVLDELHTYRGRQGADVAMLVRRLRQRLNARELLCIGTSATMSSTGSTEDQRRTVAAVASKLFGAEITETDVIDETLERATEHSIGLAAVKPLLAARLSAPSGPWAGLEVFRRDPLAVWTELTLGLDLKDQSAPRRAKPLSISDAVRRLAADASVAAPVARKALESFLTAAQGVATPDGRALFAFKLHQFISGPGKVLCTLEPEGKRQITLDAQRFAPGRQADEVLLFSTHFCRECGQEYHPVWESPDRVPNFTPREIDDVGSGDEQRRFGFLAPVKSAEQSYQGRIEDLPDFWVEEGPKGPRVKQNYRPAVPVRETVDPRGHRDGGRSFWFIPGKFRFCLGCGHEHQVHGRDINRLSSLSGEGRSSATTVLTLALLRQHFDIPVSKDDGPDPRKLLGFTDNRQDAALQAGHFNDFLYLLLIRAGLLAALKHKGGTLFSGDLGVEVFRALGFETEDEMVLSEYLANPENRYGPSKIEADRAARYVLGYRLLRDLRKGWRFNNPNLRQLDLLHIEHPGLEEFAADESAFAEGKQPGNLTPPAKAGWELLRSMSPAARTVLGRIIFEAMLRDLCVDSDYLDPARQDSMRASISGHLTERWAFGPDENLATSKFLILDKRPDSRGRKKRDDLVGGGPRSRLIREIRYPAAQADVLEFPDLAKTHGEILVELVRAFLKASEGRFTNIRGVDKSLSGWTLKDTALCWKLNTAPVAGGSRANAFFRDLYLSVSELLGRPDHWFFDFEAQEHTAQVDAERRKVRYLASQGFLPGYNFPRLPLMAWIPAAGRTKGGQDDFGSMVSRPRFLALAEFGPRSLI